MKRLLAGAVSVLALGATACSHDYSPPASATTPAPLTGVHTEFRPSGDLAGVKVSPVAPGASAGGAIVLPITGGTVSLNTLEGTIEQGGGLKYQAGGTTVELTQMVINTGAKQVSANVGGLLTPVMDLELGPVQQTGSTAQADVTYKLNSAGEQALGLGGLTSGMTVGTGVIQAKAGS